MARPTKAPGTTKTRVSLTLDPDVAAWVQTRVGADGGIRSVSEEVSHLLDMYRAAARLGRRLVAQKLTREEACGLLDALNGTWWEGRSLGMFAGGGLLAEGSDACALNHLHETWGFDRAHFTATLAGLTAIEVLALLDMAREFWNRGQEVDLEEFLADFHPAAPAEKE